jgi:uncharacterized coiled-coil protein SlyX
MSILLIVFFILMPAFAQPPGGQLPPWLKMPPKRAPEKKVKRKPIKDVNSADANSVTDPNEPAYMMFEGLEAALKRVNQGSRRETREWTRGATEDKISLVTAAQEQVMAELNFVREIAVEEGAEKTTAAIDGLIADRQQRFEEMTKKMEVAIKRLKEREEKRVRGRDRRDRTQRRRSRDDRSRRTPVPGARPF